MTLVAVVLVIAAAVGYAVGARLQHGAVQDALGDGGFSLRRQLLLVRNYQWLAGLLTMGVAALLHAVALGMAPLSVIQPLGVLALPITVLLNSRHQGISVNRSAIVGVVVALVGLIGFVTLAAGSATSTPVNDDQELVASLLSVVCVGVLTALAYVTRSKVRCIAYAAGCACGYGYVSLMIRGLVQDFHLGGIVAINPLAVLGVVSAMLLGGWLLQHSYASGPPDLVVACLTVIDPLFAVGLGIGLLGEADRVSAVTVAGEVVCAAIACGGVFLLARYHPETQKRAVRAGATVTTGHAGPSSTESS